MTALWVVLIVLLCLAVLSVLPASVRFDYENQMYLKVKYAGITVYRLPSKRDKKPSDKTSESVENKTSKDAEKKYFFVKLKDQFGLSGALKSIFGLVGQVLLRLKNFLKFVSFKILKIDISVGTDNAASTAIEYGSVCTAVYPAISVITSASRIKLRQINIKSNFNSENTTFNCSVQLSVPLVCGIVLVVGIVKEILRFKTKNNL